MILASGSDIFANLAGILSGITGLIIAIGGGIRFVVVTRRNNRRERARAEIAASVAAAETKRVLEARLEEQHGSQIQQYRQQIVDLNKERNAEREQLRQQIRDLTRDRQELLHRLLDSGRGHDER